MECSKVRPSNVRLANDNDSSAFHSKQGRRPQIGQQPRAAKRAGMQHNFLLRTTIVRTSNWKAAFFYTFLGYTFEDFRMGI